MTDCREKTIQVTVLRYCSIFKKVTIDLVVSCFELGEGAANGFVSQQQGKPVRIVLCLTLVCQGDEMPKDHVAFVERITS